MIRRAENRDISRIAEILVFDKRMDYRSIFQDDEYSFNVLQVLAVAEEYADPCLLKKIHVLDDGIVKGLIHLEGTEVVELYVDHFFQNQGIGAELIEFAKKKYHSDFLWVLEKNVRAVRFYKMHGFHVTGETKYESGTTECLLLMRRRSAREEFVSSG